MSPEKMLYGLFDFASSHLTPPPGYEWAPLAVVGALALVGLLFLTRGARWARALAGLTFLAIGGGAGVAVARAIGTPQWPTVGVGAAVCCLVGVMLFRFWQALILALTCVLAGFSVYYVRTLTVPVDNWMSASADPNFVSLDPAGTVVGAARTSGWVRFQDLWAYLSQNVPGFSTNAWAILLGAGIGGLLIGLLLPRLSRALWAATLGTVLAGVGVAALLKDYLPDALDWLLADNTRAWAIVGGVWALSVILNFLTAGKRKHKRAPKPARAEAEPAAA